MKVHTGLLALLVLPISSSALPAAARTRKPVRQLVASRSACEAVDSLRGGAIQRKVSTKAARRIDPRHRRGVLFMIQAFWKSLFDPSYGMGGDDDKFLSNVHSLSGDDERRATTKSAPSLAQHKGGGLYSNGMGGGGGGGGGCSTGG